MQLLLKLLLAHLLGDFIFQTKRWVEHKEQRKFKSGYLYAHFAIHGLLVYILVQSWMITGVITVSHALIDMLKLRFRKDDSRRWWFIFDQLLHLIVIALVAGWVEQFNPNVLARWFVDYLPIITGLVLLTMPTSVLIKNTISRWDPDPTDESPDSLQQAGFYIGILERLFVFTFVLYGQWEAVGFLIAAKSVFRFGDLKEAQDRKLTEYILIGTLMSVGLAVLAGTVVRYLL